MKKGLILLLILCAVSVSAQRYGKKTNQKEVIASGNYNFSGGGLYVGFKHNYGKSSFFGKTLMEFSFAGASQGFGESLLMFPTYNVGYSLLSPINKSMGLVPIDISASVGVGGGFERINFNAGKEIDNIPSSSSNKFIYGARGDIEVEYNISLKVGIFLNYGWIYRFNSGSTHPFLNFIGLGVSYKF